MQLLFSSRFLVSFLVVSCLMLGQMGCTRRNEPVWNLAPLIGQNIEVVTQQLGKPQAQSTLAPNQAQGTWRRDDNILRVSWKINSKRVTGFEIITRQDADAVREEEKAQLLIGGQLKEDDPRYSVEYIEAKDRPLFYTGVKVLPTPKNHNLVLRVTGSEALLQVTYQGGGAGSDSFLTLPPWEKSAVVPDDTQVVLASRIYKNVSGEPFRMKTEIVSDGKVVASAESTGQPIQCAWEF
jgi:hypothetical protein